MIYRTCTECSSETRFLPAEPANLSCQQCGSPYSTFSKTVQLSCSDCADSVKPIKVVKGDVFFCICNRCNKNIWVDYMVLGKERLARAEVEPDAKPGTLKIVIPYFAGSRRVERAVRSWLVPEVVFALTDRPIIPPGSGVCSQFYVSSNCQSLPLSRGKKEPRLPLFNDLLKNMLRLFPKSKFYGYFNSDIILPPGKSVYSLLPTGKKKAVLHHRLEVVGPSTAKPRDLRPHSVTVTGKDGFILARSVVKDIVKEFPQMIIGRPFWDTALALWLWEKYGKDQLDFAYREVWHVAHKTANQTHGDYELPGSKWNHKQSRKIFKSDAGGDIWKDVCSEALNSRNTMKRNKVGIIQPGRLGDILIVLPIAKWHYDRGREVVWPVFEEYRDIFDSVGYVNPVWLSSLQGSYEKSKEIIKAEGVGTTIDLAIGFGREEVQWRESGLSFDEWKYKQAQIPLTEKYRLQLNRNTKKEQALAEEVGAGRFKDGWVVTHSESSFGRWDFNIPDAIEVREIDGYSLIDWLGVIEGARYVYCVDSSVANLINQLDIAKGRRYIKTWHSIREQAEADRLTPALDGWEKAFFVTHGEKAYPDYINDNNAVSHIVNRALEWCKGKGVDIGGGRNPFPGAEVVDFDVCDLNEGKVDSQIKGKRDYVFSSHCLEHLDRPAEVIAQLFKVLRPGGILFLYLPHPSNKYWHPSSPAVSGLRGHKHILEPGVIKKCVEAAGFKIEEMTTEPDHYYSYYIAASSIAIKKRGKSQETRLRQLKVKRKLKIASVTIAYNAMPFIEPCIKMVKGFADQVIVVEGIVEQLFNGALFSLQSNDGTVECLQTEPDIVTVDSAGRPWTNKMEMQNAALKEVDADYIWLVDSDEFYLQKDIRSIIKILEAEKPEQVNLPIINFFKTPRWMVQSEGRKFNELTSAVCRIFKMKEGLQFTSHHPPTVSPVVGDFAVLKDICIYHFPYCFYEQVKLKSHLYQAWPSHKTIRAWLYNFFVPWSEANRLELEEDWGAWAPDVDSYTIRFKGVVPKVVKQIFKKEKGVRWER